jgi:hypothetical protein
MVMFEYLAGVVTGIVLLYSFGEIMYRRRQKRLNNEMMMFVFDENGMHALGNAENLPFQLSPPQPPPKKKPHLTIVKNEE